MVAIRKDIFLRLKAEIPFFNDFSDEEMLSFLRLMTSQTVPMDQVIFKEFDPSDTMYLLFSGGVEISKRVAKQDGVLREAVIARLKPGEAFGELGLLDHRPRSATARTTEQSLLFSISSEKLEKLARNPKLSFLSYKLFRNFSVMLATRLRDTNQKVVDLEAQRLG